MKFVQTLKYLKQGFKARRKSWDELFWIALGSTKEDDDGEFDETILENSELTSATFQLIDSRPRPPVRAIVIIPWKQVRGMAR